MLYEDISHTYSVLIFSGDTWTQVGGNFPEGQTIEYLTVDNNIPYIMTYGRGNFSVLTLSHENWTQLGDSFPD